MADVFRDPVVQANLAKLEAALKADEARLSQVIAEAQKAVGSLEGLTTEASVAVQEQARALSSSRTPIGSLDATLAALREQGALESDVNALIARQIELQAEAAAAARRVAVETEGIVGAAGRVRATGVPPQIAEAAASVQRPVIPPSGQYDTAALAAQVEAANAAMRQADATIVRQAALEGDVNAQIVKQIELQAQAAAAARRVAVETEGIVGAAEQARAASVPPEIGAAAATLHAVPPQPSGPAAYVPTAAAQVQAASQAADPVGTAAAKVKAAHDAQAAIAAQAAATSHLTDTERAYIAAAEAGAAAESRLGAATQQSILYYTQGDNALQRHGALTTDFINAAARGEVTLHEFGDQIGQTIGKFAGWTGAAAAVYGAFAAITSLSRGAIDATTTVGQLHRTIGTLDNGQAAQAIIKVAHDTNTSMKEAGDAVFQFSRTFPNLADATYAAGLALRAFQLDGVSVADQVKAQTAIHQQFGIAAQSLGPIYDELAAGQREYNARITEQIPLLQRSASAVKNAGGDLRTFIELSTIALRTTQLSGSQLGTAFLRSASTFLNPATKKGQTDRQVLETLGIDPNQNYTDLIVAALKRSATLSNAQREELSLAVFGPLLGGRTAGFFTGGASLIGDVQKALAPGKVQGTFLDEFAKEIGTTHQQLTALGNNLQQLGAELSQSGLGAPIGVLVKLLNEALTVSTRLLGVFSQLPGPLKDAAGIAAGLYAARAATQRAGVTGVPFFGQSKETQARAQISAGLTAEQDFYQQAYAGTARSAASAGLVAQYHERARNEAVEAGDEAAKNSHQKAYEAAASRQIALQAEATILQQQTVALKERINAYQAALNSGLTAEAAASALGVDFRLNTLARGVPVENPVVPVGGTVAAADAAAAAASASLPAPVSSGFIGTRAYGGAPGENLPLGSTTPGAAAADAQALEQEAARTSTELTGFGAAMASVRGTVGRVTAAVPGASTAIGAAGAALETGTSAVGGVVGAMGGFVPSLFAVGLVAGSITDTVNQMDQVAQQVKQTLAQVPRSIQQAQQQAQQLQAEAARQRHLAEGSGLPLIGGLVALINDKLYPGGFPTSQTGGQTRVDAEYNTVFARLEKEARADGRNIAATQQGREKYYQEIDKLRALATALAAGASSIGKDASAPLAGFLGSLKADEQRIRDSFRSLTVTTTDPFAQFKALPTADIVKNLQAEADRIKLYGADNPTLKQMAFAYTYLAREFANSHDDKSLQAVTQAQGYFIDAVKKDAQDLIDQAGVASTKGQKLALLGQARQLLSSTRAQMTQATAAVRVELARDQAAYNAALEALADLDAHVAEAAARGGEFAYRFVVEYAHLLATANASANTLNAAKSSLASTQTALNQVNSQLDQTLKSINTDTAKALKVPKVKVPKTPSSQDPFELTRLQRELEQARAKGDAVKVAQIGEELAREEIAAAKNERERLRGQIDLANAEYQYDQAVQARTQAMFTFLESQTTDPVKQAAIALKAATEAVTNAITNSGVGSADYYTARAKQNDAKTKLLDAHVTQRENDIQFNLDVQNIGAQTAIIEYENLLKLHNLTKVQRQDLLRKIYDLQRGAQGAFADLNLGTITLPTPYQIRRAVLGAQQQGNTFITNNNVVTIPYNGQNTAAFGATLERHLTGTGKALQRAQGVRRG